MNKLLRVASKVFPPAALIPVRGKIKGAPDGFKDKMDSSISSIDKINAENIFEWARFIYESEVTRKDILESKAQSYLMGLSISIGIISAIPLLFSSRWSLPDWAGITVATLFTAAIIFMLLAGYFALKTRQVGAMSLPSADLFKSQLEANKIGFLDNSTLLITYAKNNEKILIEKSNYLYVAEMCFVRAIWIISISIFLAVGSKSYQSIFDSSKVNNANSTPTINECTSLQKKISKIRGDIELAKSSLSSTKTELEQLKITNVLIDEKMSIIKNHDTECHR